MSKPEDKPKMPKVMFGKGFKSAKGAHGGGTPYKGGDAKMPKFMLGKGFKNRPKPGDSTENK